MILKCYQHILKFIKTSSNIIFDNLIFCMKEINPVRLNFIFYIRYLVLFDKIGNVVACLLKETEKCSKT